MKPHECPFKVGDKVIFDPDEHFYGWHVMSFDRLEIYPGKILTIEKIEREPKADYILVEEAHEARLPCDELRLFNPYEKCPFKVGDKVKFTPSMRTIERFPFLMSGEGVSIPKRGTVYVVKKVINHCWVFVGGRIPGLWILTGERDVYGFHWTDYTLVKKK